MGFAYFVNIFNTRAASLFHIHIYWMNECGSQRGESGEKYNKQWFCNDENELRISSTVNKTIDFA